MPTSVRDFGARPALRVLAAMLVVAVSAPGALAYEYLKSVTIDRSRISNASCGATLADYPMLFSVTDPDLRHTSSGGHVTDVGGDDIVFRGADAATCGGAPSCTLDHEIERYVGTTGELVAWVRLPFVNTSAAASDTRIYIEYGDSSVTSPTENPNGVWNAGFAGVWHLEEDVTDEQTSGTHDDSTLNANDGAQNGNVEGAGRIADGQDFDGTDDYIDVGNVIGSANAATLSAWVRHDNVTGVRDRYVELGNDVVIRHDGINGVGQLHFYVRTAGTVRSLRVNGVMSNGVWTHVAGTWDGTTQRLFLNGAEVASQVPGGALGAFSGGHIADDDPTETMDGIIDEVRISSTARSACWIGAEYGNQDDPGDVGAPGFYALGAEVVLYSFDYAKLITIDRSHIPGTCGTTLTDYPMLFSVVDPDLAYVGGRVTDPGGADMIFRGLDAATCGGSAPCILDHEIEKYDNTTGELVAWVRVPSVNTAAAASDTVVYLYYGDANITSPTENPTGVWDASYAGVWHFHDDFQDSTATANHGTNSGSTDALGAIANGQSFDGVSNYVYTTNVANDPQEMTIEAWFRTTVASGRKILGFETNRTGQTSINWDRQLYVGTDGLVYFGTYDPPPAGTEDVAVSTATYTDGAWHHAVGIRDDAANTVYLYVDGVQVGSAPSNMAEPGTGYWRMGSYRTMGWPNGSNGYFPGGIDEVRVSYTARSACWVNATYNNQVWPDKAVTPSPNPSPSPSSGFYTYGAALTAVELVSFTATGLDGAVKLQWETGSELDNLGFHVYRGASAEGPWERITASLIPGLGSSPEGARYGHVDTGVTNGRSYHYLLEDVETTGVRKRHGPVSATPEAGAGSGEADGDDPTLDAVSWIRYGNPEATALRVVSRGADRAMLELTTGGFYALPQEDGSVLLRVPGFDSLDAPGAPELPVRRTWLDAVAGWNVEIGDVRVREVESFASLRPADAGVPEAVVYTDGTIRPGRRPAQRRFLGAGLYPEAPASLLETGFQGELKRALVELAPVRWDAASGELLLARRLEVSVSFAGRERAELALGGARGRRVRSDGRGGRPVDEARVAAYLSAPAAGPYAAAFEELFPGQRRALGTASLRLSRHGEDVPFRVAPDPSRFGPGSTLHFVSPGPGDNPDARAAVYALETGVAGTLMAVRDARPSGAGLDSGRAREVFESDRMYMSALLEAPDPWLWDVVIAPGAKSYPFALARVVPGSAGRLQLDMVGATDTAERPDHHVRVSVNGALVADVSWDGKRPYRVDAEVPRGVLLEGTNSLEIRDVGDTGAAVSGVWLDRFAVEHSRFLVADTGSLEAGFEASGQALFSGLGSGDLVYDVSEPGSPVWLEGAAWTGTALGVRVEARRRLLAVRAAALGRPGVRLAGDVAWLRDTRNPYDYVAFGPRELLAAAEPLLQWRRDQGLSVLEVPLEDLYDAFSGGEKDPLAIRDFLAFAYHRWPAPPRYALLLGDASYDGKGRLGYPDRNHVPALMLRTPYMWTISDAVLAAVNGDDGLADLAVGRLPAANADEARRLALKVLAWERDGYRFDEATAVLVADDADHAGDFPRDALEVAATLLAGRDVEVLRVDELRGAMRGAIRGAFDRGAGLVSYFGHGAFALWASENVFNNGDVKALGPQPQQPLLLTMNCLNGYILHPILDSLAESLLKAEGKGAVAAFSPSSLSVNASARRYHDALVDEVLSGRHERLGDALLAASARYAGEGALPDLLATYLLLADPATRLR